MNINENKKKYLNKLQKRLDRALCRKGENKRNDHYVLQFLLKNFSINNNTKKGLVYEYVKSGLRGRERSIKKHVACEEGFYDMPSSGYLNNLHDRVCNEFTEKTVVKIIRELDVAEYKIKLNNTEENELANFVANQYIRTKAFRLQMKQLIKYLLEKQLISVNWTTRKQLKVIKKLIAEDYINSKEVLEYIPEIGIDFKYNTILIFLSLEIGMMIEREIFERKIFILSVDNKRKFVLSDNPVIITNHKSFPAWRLVASIEDDECIYMPISPQRCLGYAPKNKIPKKQIMKCTDLEFAFIYASIYTTMYKYIYAQTQEEYIQDNINKLSKKYFN